MLIVAVCQLHIKDFLILILRGDKGSSDSTDCWRVKRITNMFKSTDMVEAGFGYSFCMFRELYGDQAQHQAFWRDLTWDSDAINVYETWFDNDWARWLVAKRMALDLSAFSVIFIIIIRLLFIINCYILFRKFDMLWSKFSISIFLLQFYRYSQLFILSNFYFVNLHYSSVSFHVLAFSSLSLLYSRKTSSKSYFSFCSLYI